MSLKEQEHLTSQEHFILKTRKKFVLFQQKNILFWTLTYKIKMLAASVRLWPSHYVRVVFKVVGDIMSLFFRKGMQKIHDLEAKKGGTLPKTSKMQFPWVYVRYLRFVPFSCLKKLRVHSEMARALVWLRLLACNSRCFVRDIWKFFADLNSLLSMCYLGMDQWPNEEIGRNSTQISEDYCWEKLKR